jgi:hypothetical protein
MLNPLLNRFVHEKHERHKNLHKQKKLGTGFSGIVKGDVRAERA